MLHSLIPPHIARLFLLGSSTLEHMEPQPWQLQRGRFQYLSALRDQVSCGSHMCVALKVVLILDSLLLSVILVGTGIGVVRTKQPGNTWQL